MHKHLVYTFRSAPYSSPVAQEGLDAVMAAAVFEQKVSVLFVDDGVFQLLPNQTPIQQKNYAKMLQALAMYDVDRCFVHAPSLAHRASNAAPPCIPVTKLDDAGVRALLASADHLLVF